MCEHADTFTPFETRCVNILIHPKLKQQIRTYTMSKAPDSCALRLTHGCISNTTCLVYGSIRNAPPRPTASRREVEARIRSLSPQPCSHAPCAYSGKGTNLGVAVHHVNRVCDCVARVTTLLRLEAVLAPSATAACRGGPCRARLQRTPHATPSRNTAPRIAAVTVI